MNHSIAPSSPLSCLLYLQEALNLLASLFRLRLVTISRLIFSIDDPRCVNGRIHGCQVRTFERISKCVTPGVFLTEPGQTSHSSSPILTLSQAWPEIPPGDGTPSTTLGGNLQRIANTGLVSIPSLP